MSAIAELYLCFIQIIDHHVMGSAEITQNGRAVWQPCISPCLKPGVLRRFFDKHFSLE